jgi:AcrR family transcriptional regulator
VAPSRRVRRPHGRDEVVAALLDAAAKLFAESGPASVSLREVADAARVNVGLIHRHIGSKDDLLAAVLRERPGLGPLDQLQTELGLAEYLHKIFSVDFDFAGISRVHARVILDGYELIDYQDKFPAVEWLIERLGENLPDVDARARAALIAALVAGWRTFGPTYLNLVQLGHLDTDALARILAPMLDAIVESPAHTRPKTR